MTTRAAVLGHPITHSLSPVLHQAAYVALGLDDWTYVALDTTEETLADRIDALDESWAGLSLTMPLKQTVMPMLDHIDPLAVVTGAVNTVLVQQTGAARILVGANTDVYGLVTALRESGASGFTGSPARAVVLGAGATAASTLAALAELGILSAEVYVRSLGRTGDLQRAAHRMGVTPSFHPLDTAANAARTAAIVISTLPAHGADPIAEDILAGSGDVTGILLDVAYDPLTTALTAAWRARGGAAIPGQRMLLHQAAEQVRLMTGHVAPLAAMDSALAAALGGP